MTDPFKHIEEASVVLLHQGVYHPAPVFVGPEWLLYTYWKTGYMRLQHNRRTSSAQDVVQYDHLILPEGSKAESDTQGWLRYVEQAE